MRHAAVLRHLLLALPLLAAACATTPPHVESGSMCRFQSYALDVEDVPRGEIGAGSGGTPASVRDLISRLAERGTGGGGIAAAAGEGPQRPRSESMLFLSGGSQHGAFGAGFLDAWHRNAPGHQLPAFKMVTGISTGAILATFAFIDDPASAMEGYSILRERELLKLYVKVKDGKPTTFSYVNLLRKGALGDLDPLRQRLHRYIPQTMLETIYRQSGLGTADPGDDRALLVGVVDMDTGRARALDLTRMAARHHAALVAGDAAAARLRWNCYIEAVVASSSAPMAARPVFIDNRMYVDGGVRFGMFYSELKSGLVDEATRAAAGAPDQHLFLIINGDQQLPPSCGKIEERYCPDGETPTTEGAHKKWSFLPLALRSEKILANQVYRFSADSIAHEADREKLKFHSALIRKEVADYPYRNRVEALGPLVTRKCSEWRDADQQAEDPIQFEARYMRCLIAYGADQEERVYKWHNISVP